MMKTRYKIIWSLLSIIGTLIISYMIVAFVDLEIDFREWTKGQRAGVIIFGLLVSILPTSAICIFNTNNKGNHIRSTYK